MNPNKAISLRNWLARREHPATVKGETLDGDEKIVRIGVARSKFRDAENALAGCVRCEALDEKGAILRVWESPDFEEQRAEKERDNPPAADPLSGSVERITAIMADACDRAVQRHSEMVRNGFEQMGALVQVLSARNAALEKAWQQLFFSQQSQATEQDPNAALLNALLPAVLAGGGMMQPPTNGAKKDVG